MKVLITGANGFLGQHLCIQLAAQFEVIATGRGQKRLGQPLRYHSCDLAEEASIREIIMAEAPEVIIHAAAMSRPDECLQHPRVCEAVNVQGTRNLVAAAGSLGRPVHIIYISSDFVLGEGGPHDERAAPAPLNYYGQTKLAAEAIISAMPVQAIVRPVFMYGPVMEGMRPGFLQWIKQSLEEGREIKLVSDQQRTPSYVGDVCQGVAAIIRRRATGIYHLAGTEVLSPYQMGLALAGHLNLDASLLQAVDAASFPEPVRRARKGGLDCTKARKELGFEPVGFAEGLRLSFG